MHGEARHVVVVGSGLAGLSCALELARREVRVLVVTAGQAGRDGCSHRVHALAPAILLTAPRLRGDSPDLFYADLVRKGQGRLREETTRVFAQGARRAADEIVELLDLEPLDREVLLLPGDSYPRGLRCRPRRGRMVLAPLVSACRQAGVEFAEGTLAVGVVVTETGAVGGVVVAPRGGGAPVALFAQAVVLACGGPAAVFPRSTSPRWCRGSGLALGKLAGALLHDPHRFQALPVTATSPCTFPGTAPLLAGRIAVDGRAAAWPGEGVEDLAQFVAAAELAGKRVELLTEGRLPGPLPARLGPGEEGGQVGGIGLTAAVHHGIGGVAIDAWGRSSVSGLYACGEAAGGVQGARRTMGTGLIEARLFGVRAARAVLGDRGRLAGSVGAPRTITCPCPGRSEALERWLDTFMALFVAQANGWDPVAALGTLQQWPEEPARNRRAWLAGIRWAAARAMLESLVGGGAGGNSGEGCTVWGARG
ncbi:MAG: FAD-dependent oxidoreductase [Thermoanaerobaculaceae bacterium]|nr:FAD-dependent oxidoreductase [Thermoanaerobaculaceae bacterium]